MRTLLPLLALIGACSAPPSDSGDGTLDARVEVPDPGDGNLQYLSGDLAIPAREQRQYCTFFTYDGPDTAVHQAESYQDPSFGHHVFLLKTFLSVQDAPDGYTMDCTSVEDFNMAQTDELYIPEPKGDGRTGMELPDGMAVKLTSGTRLVLQSHFINYSDQPIVAADGVNLELMDPADVTTWAAPFAQTTLDIHLPPHETTTIHLDCGWDKDVNLLFLIGHMHENGVAFSIDDETADETDRIYDVPTWTPYYRDNPPVNRYAAGEFQVKAGDVFHTTCTWDNETDEELTFPSEMCATVGIAYPSEEPLYCAHF